MEVPPEERFRAVADVYAKFRPGYPDDVIDRILDAAGMRPAPAGTVVVDVGCGTGISSRAFASRGLRVIGVDPNAAMLDKAVAAGGGPEYREGRADATGLPALSADLVVAAQCFHWLEPSTALAEFRRILKPGRRVAVFWNLRRVGLPFNDAYEALLKEFCPDYQESLRDDATLAQLRGRPEPRDAVDLHHERSEFLDREAFLGRAHSASYIAHGVKDRAGLEAGLERVFAEHAQNGRVEWALRVEGICFRLS